MAPKPAARPLGWLIVAVVLADQLSKLAAIAWLRPSPPLTVIPGFFRLVYVENTGAAWGMFAGGQIFLVAFSILIAAFLFWRRREIFGADRLGRVIFSLLLGGIAGNLIDRIRLNAVVDFLDFFWKQSHFPAFNLADSAICIATFLLILTQAVRKQK